MKYICDYCKYETDDKNNWSKHKKSKKHINKSNTNNENITKIPLPAPKLLLRAPELLFPAPKKENKIIKKLICYHCNLEFNKSFNLARHLKTCKYAKCNENITIIQKEFSKYKKATENVLKEKENEMKIKLLEEKIKSIENEKKLIENEKKIIEITLEEKVKSIELTLQEQIKILKTENTFHKQLINSAGGLIGKSMSTMSYLLLNHNNAPALKLLPDYSIITKNDESLIKNLIYHNRKETLEKYIGDFIVEQYKKDDPNLQAMWSSDTERLNYFIRELTKTKNGNGNYSFPTKDNKDNKKLLEIFWIHKNVLIS